MRCFKAIIVWHTPVDEKCAAGTQWNDLEGMVGCSKQS